MSGTDCINSRNVTERCGKRLRPLGKNSVAINTVSQTLSSLTIGAGATVIFTSGVASFGGGGKASGTVGGTVVPEPGTLALEIFGGLTALNRRRHAAV